MGYFGQKMLSDATTGGGMAEEGFSLSPEVAGAGILTAGSFLSQYLAQKAADERNKRQMIAQTHQQYGANVQDQLGQLMGAYKSALLG